MSYFAVNGGHRLSGEATVCGAKNSVLPILAATLINGGENVIHNCTRLKDVDSALKILRHLGCKTVREGKTVTVDSQGEIRYDIPEGLMREMRSSVIFLGPLIARCKKARLFAPGGCELGPRPIDLHLDALSKLGVHIEQKSGEIICTAEKMRGCDIVLGFPSVGATENIMLAATACEGTTRIINAAREPEIADLQEFLLKAGAKISGAGTSEIIIEGNKKRQRAEHTVMPDRIEAATYLCAVAACGGDVLLKNACFAHIETVASLLSDAGCEITPQNGEIRIKRQGRLRSLKPVNTMPYPGFPTDAQAQLCAAATIADGTTVFCENIFENRYRHVSELKRLGADIRLSGKTAIVVGVPKLYGASVKCTDLRGGAALLIAAMAAEGSSKITDIYHIDRGYENAGERYAMLGADVKREED